MEEERDVTPRSPAEVLAEIVDWHQKNGGHGKNLKGHALRILNEVVELCLAAGASGLEIMDQARYEIGRQIEKGSPKGDIPEELADVSILTDILAHYAGADLAKVREEKLKILWDRKWVADEDGVLWRRK